MRQQMGLQLLATYMRCSPLVCNRTQPRSRKRVSHFEEKWKSRESLNKEYYFVSDAVKNPTR
jgi:hypothetical protein